MRMNWEQLLCADRVRGKAKKSPLDLRTEFEKDYHRIINSASFRRLQDKTQVFPLDKSDFIRTRLTHSLEVSSFGKSLGQNVAEKIYGIVSSIEDYIIPNNFYDLIMAVSALEHVDNKESLHQKLLEIRDGIRKNGIACLIINCNVRAYE